MINYRAKGTLIGAVDLSANSINQTKQFVILVSIGHPEEPEYVVARYINDSEEWFWGHYTGSLTHAANIFADKVSTLLREHTPNE